MGMSEMCWIWMFDVGGSWLDVGSMVVEFDGKLLMVMEVRCQQSQHFQQQRALDVVQRH